MMYKVLNNTLLGKQSEALRMRTYNSLLIAKRKRCVNAPSILIIFIDHVVYLTIFLPQ